MAKIWGNCFLPLCHDSTAPKQKRALSGSALCVELSQQMALEKLRESMRCRQHTMLKYAIVDCERFDKLKENKEVRNANRTLAVIEARLGTLNTLIDWLIIYSLKHVIKQHKQWQQNMSRTARHQVHL